MGTTAALNTSAPLSGPFEADPVHSNFGFSVRFQGVSIFRGSLTQVEARLRHGRLEGTAKVDSISIRTPEQFRAHVLSSEFFDVANHPEVTFVSTALAIDSTGAATGRWTAPAADAFGNARAHLDLEAVIDRTEWNMNWNMALPSGGNALANAVTLTIELSLVDQA